jgi:hypothetical protein
MQKCLRIISILYIFMHEYKYWFNNEQGNAVNLQKQEKNYNISKKL